MFLSLKFYRLKKYIADWFLPNRCPVCKKLIVWDKLVCDKCRSKLEDVSSEVCPVCGKKPCADHSKLRFESITCLYPFDGTAKEGIYALKYDQGYNFGEFAAEQLARLLHKRDLAESVDIITCVPMSRQRLRKRRKNHAAVIARTLSRELGKPFDNKLLVHLSSEKVHHHLKAAQRLANAELSFKVFPKHNDISGKTVLLCDDVYTTGATMNSCAALLVKMGADKVIAACAATTFLRKE